jgi:hypothetical protein
VDEAKRDGDSIVAPGSISRGASHGLNRLLRYLKFAYVAFLLVVAPAVVLVHFAVNMEPKYRYSLLAVQYGFLGLLIYWFVTD